MQIETNQHYWRNEQQLITVTEANKLNKCQQVACAVLHPCVDFMAMLRLLINCRFIIY